MHEWNNEHQKIHRNSSILGPMRILGISCYYHDAAAALIEDGKIVAAAQEERFTRKKHDPSFPRNAIKYCLEEANVDLGRIDAVAFYDKPLLKFERLLETYYNFSPQGIASFISAMPVWINEKLFLKRNLKEGLKDLGPLDCPILFPEHHLSHASSAFYPSPFEEAAILTIDGVGEWTTCSIAEGRGKDITIHKEMHFPHSLGLLYSSFTYYLGFRVNSGEYKLMGLAPYGNAGKQTEDFVQKIKEHMVTIYDDGSIWINQRYFNYATGLRMTKDRAWERLLGVPRRESETPIDQVHCDLALAIQQVTEEVVMKLAEHARQITGLSWLCLAGGVALNCVANGKLLNSGYFEDIFIQPAAGDAGGALGAALASHHIHFEKDRHTQSGDGMSGAYLGPSVQATDISKCINNYGAKARAFETRKELCEFTASQIAEGKVIGWVQGRMEFGPRALGNRSIIGDPRSPEMQKKLNLKIKYRESFRPFAPAVLREKATDFFELETDSPYMLLVHPVAANLRNDPPQDYETRDMRSKLYFERSSLPAITHVDYSARIQTVDHTTNPHFHQLISSFEEITGCPVLINTSFNVRGEPIVNTAEDAYRCFMRTEMDILVINDHVFLKEEQPDFKDKVEWQVEFKLD